MKTCKSPAKWETYKKIKATNQTSVAVLLNLHFKPKKQVCVVL